MALSTTCQSGDEPTTLMIRSLPRRFTAWDLVKELEQYVRRTAFDYVYVPWDRNNTNNMGYAFVNFVSADIAAGVRNSMDDRAWRTGSRSRPVRVVPAHVQGLRENLLRFADEHDGLDVGHAPLLFSGGSPVGLAESLQAFRAPPNASCESSRTSTCSGELLGSPPSGTSESSSAVGDDNFWEAERANFDSEARAAASADFPTSPAGSSVQICARPPPGLEDAVLDIVKSSPGYIASRAQVATMIAKVLALPLPGAQRSTQERGGA